MAHTFCMAGGILWIARSCGWHHDRHYFVLRRRRLAVDDLYQRGGVYQYRTGVNPRAFISLVCGVCVALLGLVLPNLRWLYDYAWFVGFGVSGLTYVMFMHRRGGSFEQSDSEDPGRSKRRAAAAERSRGACRSESVPVLLRRAVHARLPHAYRHSAFYKENLNR